MNGGWIYVLTHFLVYCFFTKINHDVEVVITNVTSMQVQNNKN